MYTRERRREGRKGGVKGRDVSERERKKMHEKKERG